MATYRRTFAAGFRCAASLLNRGACQSRRSVSVVPAIIRKNWASLSLSAAAAAALCAVPFAQKPESLSHEDLVRRASSLVTSSANTFLSQTTLALLDSLSSCKQAISSLATLHGQYVASISKLTPAEESEIWKVILRLRQEVKERREDCRRFESCWTTAVNLSKLAAEAAFSAGADQASVTTQTCLQVAQSQVEHAQQQLMEAERELQTSKAEESERLEKALSSEMEDDDVPDAYLRED